MLAWTLSLSGPSLYWLVSARWESEHNREGEQIIVECLSVLTDWGASARGCKSFGMREGAQVPHMLS